LPTTIRSAFGLLGDVEDRLGRVPASTGWGLHLDPLLLGDRRGASRTRLDVLARADLVLDIGRSVRACSPSRRAFSATGFKGN